MFTQCKCQWFSFWKAGMKAWVMLGVSWQICTMLTLSHSWGWEDINEETFTFPQTVVIIKPSGTPNLSLGKWLCSLIDCLGSHWFSLELIWLFGWEIWFMFHIWVQSIFATEPYRFEIGVMEDINLKFPMDTSLSSIVDGMFGGDFEREVNNMCCFTTPLRISAAITLTPTMMTPCSVGIWSGEIFLAKNWPSSHLILGHVTRWWHTCQFIRLFLRMMMRSWKR